MNRSNQAMRDEPSGHEDVLRQLGVTPVEYEAMLCPYYEIPFGPRKMASWTVLEHDAGCRKECTAHTADDYLAAINGMLEKGWLAIEGPPPHRATRGKNAPHKPEESPGVVVFTKAGYLLHRRIVEALLGRDFLDEVDALTIHNRALRELRFYARTERHCARWLRGVRQVASPHSISALLGFPADIEQIQGPAKIGSWRPSAFITHRSGYTAAVRYKRRRRRRFCIAGLQMESWVESLAPVYICGTIKGDRFHWCDEPSWRKPTFQDKDAVYRWVFTVDGPPTKSVPTGAVLEDETEPAGYRMSPNPLFSVEESPSPKRNRMLPVHHAKAIVTRCAERYLEARVARG